MRKTGIVLDLDGTLIDSRADLVLAMNLTRTDMGLPPLTQAEVVRDLGEGTRTRLSLAMPELEHRLDELLLIHQGHYLAHLLDQTRLYPGVIEALERFREGGATLMVVTNKPRISTDPILAGLGLSGFLSAVVAGGDCPALKPDPAPLFLALEQSGCRAEDAWMVGDHCTDLESGRRAGLKRCFCRYGFGDPGGETWDLAVDDLAELADFLG